MYVLILRKNGLGYILVDFFANSSGHPVHIAFVAQEQLATEDEPLSLWTVALN
jgi:hypothetical protein